MLLIICTNSLFAQIIPLSCELSLENTDTEIICNDKEVSLTAVVSPETDAITISLDGQIFETRILENDENLTSKSATWSEADYDVLKNLDFGNHTVEIVTEDSNSGSACFNFLSFSYEECESNGSEIEVPILYPFQISVNLLLQAHYNEFENEMNNTSNMLGLLPQIQPFNNNTFNYIGSEEISSFDDEAVDWVLLSLRNEIGVILDKVAALLHNDGTVRTANGSTDIIFAKPQPLNANYFISVDHKSHLSLMTKVAYGNNSLIDFTLPNITSGQSQTININNKEYMIAGDLDSNGIINSLDYNIWANDAAAVSQYLIQDIDGNGLVNNLDYNYWAVNRQKVGELRLIENGY